MSALTLNHNLIQEVVVKDKDKKRMAKMDSLTSYEEALKILKEASAELKEAGKKRVEAPESVEDSTIGWHYAKGLSISGVALATHLTLAMTGVLPSGVEGFTVSMAIMFGGPLTTMFSSFSSTLISIGSPLKTKKARAKYSIDKALADMKEEEYAELEAKILKKVKKHVKVINARLQEENRAVKYSNRMHCEGFSIVELGPLDDWDQELFKVESIKKKAQPLELASTP